MNTEPTPEKPELPSTAKRLARLESLVREVDERRERAAGRLAGHSGLHWYFAILGLKTGLSEFEFRLDGTKVARLRKVDEHPGEIELSQALKESHLAPAIARYAHGIDYELEVDEEIEGSTDQEFALSLAWWIISVLRIRTQAELLIPCAINYPWSTVPALDRDSCEARLLEDVPRAHRLSEPVSVGKADLEWVIENLVQFVELLANPAFSLAADALCTHQHQASDRMMAALLWSGIEAIFDINTELRFRLATAIAVV